MKKKTRNGSGRKPALPVEVIEAIHPLMPVKERREPHLIVTLNRRGRLQVEMPGINGSRRQVPLNKLDRLAAGMTADMTVEEAMIKILQAQLVNPYPSLGEDGAPTISQMDCWLHHDQSPSGHGCTLRGCPHFGHGRSARRSKSTYWQSTGDGSVKVRKFKRNGQEIPIADANPEDLGF